MRSERHTGAKILLLAVIAILGLSIVLVMSTIPAVAQETQTGNETTGTNETVNGTSETVKNVEYQLEDVDIRSVEFRDGTVIVDAYYHEAATVAITDSGAIKGLGSNDGTGVSFATYSHGPGEHRLTMNLGSDDELVTVQQGEKMYAASGDRTVVNILAHSPGVNVVRWSAIGGGLGVLIAAGLVVGILKRKHHNSYKELLSEERVRVQEDTVDGALGTVQRFARRHTFALLAAATIVAYLVAVRLGVVPSIPDLWSRATDAQRVLVVSALSLLVLGFAPVYVVITRLWEPAKEFVFDVDARDVLDAAIGAKGGLAALEDIESADDVEDAVEVLEEEDITIAAVYSGSPERVAKMRVDGEPAEIQTAGGRGHLVQDFDPAKNRADGTWPGLADDFELARERSKIDGNREILEDYATVGRRIVGALPAIRAGADTSAVAAVDRKFGQAVAIDSDPVDDIMDSAVSGTRFERYYSKGQSEEKEDEYDEDEETVNDDSNDGGEDDE